MKIKPLGDRILVRPSKQEEVTRGGIVLPDSAEKEQKEQGEVIAVGDGEKVRKLGVKVGDTVVFGKYSGEEIEVESAQGERGKAQYKFLKEEDVLGIIEK